ncbi:hypothetical protein Pint_00551 [Pistacia integerrima]|uniref:Uncharacterized protein n=1 Tax=Pistacia integerrima TaxID=434235 RepID=A0ACC0ZPT6_9ROSI|nr:hypothetical protein Pint_00551 [Pistacia integerrima]
MKETLQGRENIEEEEATVAIWDCGSPLYDSYELVSLTHLIERHLMALPSLGGSKRLTTKFYCPSDVSSNVRSITHTKPSSSSAISSLSDYVGRKLLKRKIGVGEVIDKRKRLKILCGMYKAFGFWKKKKYSG